MSPPTTDTFYGHEYIRHLVKSIQGGDNNGLIHVSTPLILATAIPLVLIAIIDRRIDYGLAESLGVGVVRSYVQLMCLGVILHPIFRLGMDMPWVVGLYVLAMILIATNEAISRPKYTFPYHPLFTFLTLLTSMTLVGSFAFGLILRPTPLWNPQYIIPLCGMLLGNTINGVSLSVTSLTTQLMEGGRREVELCLSFGASGLESIRRLMKDAISVGVTPMINQMNVIGLVSIPGMMTGQILGGSPVTEAARYQVLILWLISIVMFSTVFMNAFVVYRVAFETGKHMLRTDRFIEVVKSKKRKGFGWDATLDFCKAVVRKVGMGLRLVCLRKNVSSKGNNQGSDVEQQLMSGVADYGTSNKRSIEILTKRGVSVATLAVDPLLMLSSLQFSVPRSHTKRVDNSQNKSSIKSPPSSSSLTNLTQAEQRVLCTDLNVCLSKGEIGIVRGPSGSGKSTLLRVMAGLSPMDGGDVAVDGMSLSTCSSRGEMTRWRNTVRYVTQYKVDIPGTPREFIIRVSKFHSSATKAGAGDENYQRSPLVEDPIAQTTCSPMAEDMIAQTISYIEKWGMKSSTENGADHLIDKEWKILSGGECQRMLLAISLASRPRVLLLDEATSGLDGISELQVEESILEYVTAWDAAVLWVTHSDDIAERLLK